MSCGCCLASSHLSSFPNMFCNGPGLTRLLQQILELLFWNLHWAEQQTPVGQTISEGRCQLKILQANARLPLVLTLKGSMPSSTQSRAALTFWHFKDYSWIATGITLVGFAWQAQTVPQTWASSGRFPMKSLQSGSAVSRTTRLGLSCLGDSRAVVIFGPWVWKEN